MANERSCPICSSDFREVLHGYRLTYGHWQTIAACQMCGMVYAYGNTAADYGDDSIYTAPGAIGSGISKFDRERLDGVADFLFNHSVGFGESILDVGCAQGGMLGALGRAGFTQTYGMDPSANCAFAAQAQGHNAYVGSLDEKPDRTYDVLILSHVLEHVENALAGLHGVMNRLANGGRAYIEVPDAARYSEFGHPFLDFNEEHINHFDMQSLQNAVHIAGFVIEAAGRRVIDLTNGSQYPAIYVWVKKNRPFGMATTKTKIMEYIAKSQQVFHGFNENLAKALEGYDEAIIWGAGGFMTHVAALPVFKRVKIVQVIDRNPSLHGKMTHGCLVQPPSKICLNRIDRPIVIAALVATKAIEADIEKMGLDNSVVTLYGDD